MLFVEELQPKEYPTIINIICIFDVAVSKICLSMTILYRNKKTLIQQPRYKVLRNDSLLRFNRLSSQSRNII